MRSPWGRQAMAHLQEDLAAVARSDEPLPEPLTAAQAALPLALGADGVMVPFRPEAGMPWEKIRWREVKVGVLDVYFINPTPVYFGVDKI